MSDKDIILRGLGEFMHLVKEQKLSTEDILAYCSLVWRVDKQTCLVETDSPLEILQKLNSLDLLRIVEPNLVMLNPHVAGMGDSVKRGEFRVKFRSLVK